MKLVPVALLLTAFTTMGCGTSPVATPEADIDITLVTPASLELCGACGQVAGGESCCAEGAETCSCGLHKGSPGCCKVEPTDGHITLCSGCGQVKGSESCCAEDGEACSCGWHKGSPACCKIDKPEGEESDKLVMKKSEEAEAGSEE